MAVQEESYNINTSKNTGYNQASALQIRLETQGIIEDVELFLRGSKLVVEEKDNKIKTTRVNMGFRKANDRGIQFLLSWLRLILNPQTVQGNFPTDDAGFSSVYDNFICWAREDLACHLVTNCYDFEMKDHDIEPVVDSLMNIVEPFLTRLIGNKERESYSDTIRHFESNTMRGNTDANNPLASMFKQ